MIKPWRSIPIGRKANPDGLTLYSFERLGNQLFSYATVLAQARRLSVPCYVNKAFFEQPHPDLNYHCTYELDIFDNGLVVPDDNAYHIPVFLGSPAMPIARWWHNHVPSIVPGNKNSIYMEQSFTYEPRLRSVQSGTTVIGYFQSWRYFDDYGDEIRKRISQLRQPSEWYLKMCKRLQPGTGSIGLHVRRGDYMLPAQQKLQGLAMRPYYERSLQHLRKMGFDGPIYLATDSWEIVRKEFAGLGEFHPIDPPPDAHPLEVILLLSRVDGLITANSSFSWWAGFIGERPGQVVIAPRPWFTQTGIDTRDLLLPNWLTLDRNAYDRDDITQVGMSKPGPRQQREIVNR